MKLAKWFIIFHQPRFPWNSRGPISLTIHHHLGEIGTRVFGRYKRLWMISWIMILMADILHQSGLRIWCRIYGSFTNMTMEKTSIRICFSSWKRGDFPASHVSLDPGKWTAGTWKSPVWKKSRFSKVRISSYIPPIFFSAINPTTFFLLPPPVFEKNQRSPGYTFVGNP